jgi:hypothetical protein
MVGMATESHDASRWVGCKIVIRLVPPGRPFVSKLASSNTVDLGELREFLGEWRNGAGSLAERLVTAVEQANERGE